MSLSPPPPPGSPLDSYIIERIIRALELVSDMGSKLALLEKATDRHNKILEGNGDSLPTQVRLLREAVMDLEKTWDEKKRATSEEVKGQWAYRVAVVQALPATIGGALMYMLTKWLGG